MQLKFRETDERFRLEIRSRIAEILPRDIQRRHRHATTLGANVDDQRVWLRILAKEGWSVPAWPTEYGGTGWSALHRFLFENELYSADAPEFHWIGSHMVGPVIYTYGSPQQRHRFLAPIREGAHIWAQGFSEPSAGSDLASLRTNAVLEGDHYLVNGQKIWTSGAFEADWGFFLVKTSLTDKPQRSISVLLIDLKSRGVTIRRIRQINGEAHLCEVFLDNVEVPADQLVGEAGKGWTYAKFLLDHERATSSYIYWCKRELQRCKDLAFTLTENGRPLIESPAWASRIAHLQVEVSTLEWSVLRVLAEEYTEFPVSAAASVLKLYGSEMQQALTELQVDLMASRSARDFGPDPVILAESAAWPPIAPGRTGRALMARAATIYGGTKQIQKNILARLAFGL